MILKLEAPSKTFLFGEYAVLKQGPAVILNTEPRFSLTAKKSAGSAQAGLSPFPKGSPADKWFDQRSPLLSDWELHFTDPHDGRGGFGASGAQFLFVHALTTFLQSSVSRAVGGYDAKALWNDYQVLGSGSGADVLAQLVGQAAKIEMHAPSSEASAWPFEDISFFICRTQNKVATHEHLQTLESLDFEPLVRFSSQCFESFLPSLRETFLNSLKSFSQELRRLGLQHPQTLEMLTKLETSERCLLAKGCGALGADTILVLTDQNQKQNMLDELKTQQLEVIATESELAPGLTMQWSWNEG